MIALAQWLAVGCIRVITIINCTGNYIVTNFKLVSTMLGVPALDVCNLGLDFKPFNTLVFSRLGCSIVYVSFHVVTSSYNKVYKIYNPCASIDFKNFTCCIYFYLIFNSICILSECFACSFHVCIQHVKTFFS